MAEKLKRRPNVSNLEAAVRLYYEKFELSTSDIKQIFCDKSDSFISKLKKVAREHAVETDRLPWDAHSIPTEAAFEAWGLNISDLEKRYAKLQRFGEKEGGRIPKVPTSAAEVVANV